MVCPRCKTYHDILQYGAWGIIEEFSDDTVPINICPSCNWKFAPATHVSDLANFRGPDGR